MKRGGQLRSTAGFTLIEIGVVLFIMAVLSASLFPYFQSEFTERRLRQPANALADLASQARATALRSGNTVSILFAASNFRLVNAAKETIPQEDTIPEFSKTVEMEVRPWDGTEWNAADGFQWDFLPSGVCGPVSVRFLTGSDYLIVRFDPLTAGIAEEEFLFQ